MFPQLQNQAGWIHSLKNRTKKIQELEPYPLHIQALTAKTNVKSSHKLKLIAALVLNGTYVTKQHFWLCGHIRNWNWIILCL